MLDETAIILVGIVPKPRDLEIARVLGWYRIPLRTAPKIIEIDYLAFYQPASFGKHKWQIEYVAPVRGHELTTRRELLKNERDHPRANEEYYKIQIGPLERLGNPIIAKKWKRVTFLYTTGKHLISAKTIDDLIMTDTDKKLIWRLIRERADEKYSTKHQKGKEDIDSLLLNELFKIYVKA